MFPKELHKNDEEHDEESHREKGQETFENENIKSLNQPHRS